MTGNETIAAISTGLTKAGISIVRLSGDQSIEIADRLFISKKSEHCLKNAGSHTLNYGFFSHGENGGIIDEVLVSVMKGPHSYTGEDVVEINCHGGIYNTSLILEEVIKAGAVAAGPGEFTKRAFLNGRMDLSQAEAVMDLIASESDISHRTSMSQLKGSLRNIISDLRERILIETAYIEAALDDPEHYTLDDYGEELREKICVLLDDLLKLSDSYKDGRIIRSGIRTVILGKPNAGKSSLLNMLSGRDRAIVSTIPGTTRDTLEEDIRIRELGLTLIDTAGIRETTDEIERLGIERSFASVEEADLVLYVADSSVEMDDNDAHILKELSKWDVPVVYLLNKSDLSGVTDMDGVRSAALDNGLKCEKVISFSAVSGDGMEELKAAINDMFYHGDIGNHSDQVIITNKRHLACIDNAVNSLKLVMESIDDGMPEDVYTVDLMQAYEELGYIIGDEVGDDLVDEIFSRFCMGK